MKLASTIAVSFFLATEAFSPHTPVSPFAVSNKSNEGMTMRVGKMDLDRRQRLLRKIDTVRTNPSKELIESELLTKETSDIIEKCNWKLRKVLIRKVKSAAYAFGLEVDSGFGNPPSQEERESQEQAIASKIKAEKAAIQKVSEEEAVKRAAVKKKKDEKKEKAKEIAILVKENILKAKEKASIAEEKPVAEEKEANPAPAVEEEKEAKPAPVAEKKEANPAPAVEEEKVEEKAEPEPEPEPAPAPSAGAVTPKTIKALRDATGAGMMDCKKALLETNGDAEAAADVLRTKGLAKADKKASRVAAEGKIAYAASDDKAVMVEVNCETDFVAKDGNFLGYVDKVANAALSADNDSIDDLLSQEVDGVSLETERQAMVAKIGENIQVRRMASRGGPGSTLGGYVHMNKIGVLVELEGGDEALATDIAMHVAAMNPPFATKDDVPAEDIEKERAFLVQQVEDSGKPPEIIEKMVEGRLRKYLEEICLVSQTYVKTNDKTVGKLLEENGATIKGFTRVAVGEGIEKKEDDFAAEVAKMAGGN